MTFRGVIGVALVVGVVGIIGANVAAMRSHMSARAWVLFKIVPFLVPDFSAPGVLQRAIEKDHRHGPTLPSWYMRKRIRFSDETWGADRIFRVAPSGGTHSPVRIFFIHGGGYVFDLQDPHWSLIWGLVSRTGAEVVAPIYPLAPEHGWREGLDMVQRVYLELVKERGADNIVIMGDSAGGGLALALAQALRNAKLPAPAAVVLFSPWLDLSVTAPDQPELARRDPLLTIGFLRAVGLMWAKDVATNDPRISPLYGDQAGLPPTIVFTGTWDILNSDSKRLAAVAGNVTLREYPSMMHVWPVLPIPEGRRALDEAAAFINQHTSNRAPN
jgi:epsilon-lactone hydrolase